MFWVKTDIKLNVASRGCIFNIKNISRYKKVPWVPFLMYLRLQSLYAENPQGGGIISKDVSCSWILQAKIINIFLFYYSFVHLLCNYDNIHMQNDNNSIGNNNNTTFINKSLIQTIEESDGVHIKNVRTSFLIRYCLK